MAPLYGRILRLEGLLLIAAGLTHFIYCVFFLDWSIQPLVANLGAFSFAFTYSFFGAMLVMGKDRLLLLTLIVNLTGLTAVIVTGPNSPLIEIDPYLIVVDIISISTLIWLNIQKYRNSKSG